MVDNTLENPVKGAWIAPLISTVLTVPGSLIAYFFGGLSAMACDSCNGAEAESFTSSFDTAFTLLKLGLVVALVLLLVSWSLPSDEKNVSRRLLFAVLAPCTVAAAAVLFGALVDWPS